MSELGTVAIHADRVARSEDIATRSEVASAARLTRTHHATRRWTVLVAVPAFADFVSATGVPAAAAVESAGVRIDAGAVALIEATAAAARVAHAIEADVATHTRRAHGTTVCGVAVEIDASVDHERQTRAADACGVQAVLSVVALVVHGAAMVWVRRDVSAVSTIRNSSIRAATDARGACAPRVAAVTASAAVVDVGADVNAAISAATKDKARRTGADARGAGAARATGVAAGAAVEGVSVEARRASTTTVHRSSRAAASA